MNNKTKFDEFKQLLESAGLGITFNNWPAADTLELVIGDEYMNHIVFEFNAKGEFEGIESSKDVAYGHGYGCGTETF